MYSAAKGHGTMFIPGNELGKTFGLDRREERDRKKVLGRRIWQRKS